MSCHPLSNDTGGTADDRRSEADRILKIIADEFETGGLTDREARFVEDIADGPVSPKQLFWLRDIKDKYL